MPEVHDRPLDAPLVTQAGSPPIRLRIFELILVCAIAFGGSILHSTAVVFGGAMGRAGVGALTWLNLGLLEVASLALVWYVLQRRSASFNDLGFGLAKRDLAWSFPILLLGIVAGSVVYYVLSLSGFASATGSAEIARVNAFLFGPRVPWLTFALLFLNPVFEELIVRAYVMTEVKQITGSTVAAIVLSTLLQTSYHLYQGFPLALSAGASFLVFSLYYAKTRRITPIILAHFYLDLFSILRAWLAHG